MFINKRHELQIELKAQTLEVQKIVNDPKLQVEVSISPALQALKTLQGRFKQYYQDHWFLGKLVWLFDKIFLHPQSKIIAQINALEAVKKIGGNKAAEPSKDIEPIQPKETPKGPEEAKLKEQDAQKKVQEEAKLKEQQEAQKKAAEEAKLKEQQEAMRKVQEEAQKKAAEEAKLKEQQEAQKKAQAEEARKQLVAPLEKRIGELTPQIAHEKSNITRNEIVLGAWEEFTKQVNANADELKRDYDRDMSHISYLSGINMIEEVRLNQLREGKVEREVATIELAEANARLKPLLEEKEKLEKELQAIKSK